MDCHQKVKYMKPVPEHQQAATVNYVDPVINALPDKSGRTHEITDVVISFLRDINVFYSEEERGEYTAVIPVKVIFKRKV